MLSVAMIVKNEVQTLESTVLSVKEHVDEIVIGVDEESSDGTRELAEKLADRVVDIQLSAELRAKGSVKNKKEWGFCAARNEVLSRCKKENWRVTLDGHEIVKNPGRMRDAVEAAVHADADSISAQVEFEPDDNGIPQLLYRQVRIFAPSVVYNRPIHNVPVARKTIFNRDVVFVHMKKKQASESRQERNVQRADANIKGLAKEVKKNPRDSRAWFYLATAYKESALWQKAIDAYLSYLEVGGWKEERWQARTSLGACYSRLGKNDKAREQFVLSLEEFPVMAESYYWLGHLAYKQQRFREAQVWMERCCAMDVPNVQLFVWPKIYKVDRFDLLSMTYNHLGMYKEAIEQANRALESVDNSRIEKNIEYWMLYSKDYDGYYSSLWKKKPNPTNLQKKRLALTAALLDGKSSVLDVGSGPGWLADELGEGVYYTGLDVSFVAREIMQEKGYRAVGSFDELEQTYTGCVLGEVLEHVDDDLGLINKVMEYLVDGATVVVSVPLYGKIVDKSHVRDYKKEELEALLSNIGKVEFVEDIEPWTVYKCKVELND